VPATGLESSGLPEGAGLPESRGLVQGERWLVRFDKVERAAHWSTALLFLVLIFTGASLYVPALVGFVGRRELVTLVHLYAGLLLPVPLLVSLSGSWGKGMRADLARLNRWSSEDRRWIRLSLGGGPTWDVRNGKFNAGQKLNAAFVGGVIVVMFMTGCIMRWPYLWPLEWRTGATFVHDLVAYCLVVVVVGHIAMALSHPPALRGMITGKTSREWAAEHAPLWLEELKASEEKGPVERA